MQICTGDIDKSPMKHALADNAVWKIFSDNRYSHISGYAEELGMSFDMVRHGRNNTKPEL